MDAAVFQYLQKVPLCRDFVFQKVYVDYEQAKIEQLRHELSGEPTQFVATTQFIAQHTLRLKQIIQRFPRSTYAPWARLALLYVEQVPFISLRYEHAGPTVELFNNLRQSRIKLEQLALKLPLPVAATAWLYAGYTALHTEDRAAAGYSFNE